MAWLAREGFDPEYGARPLQRLINRHILHPLSKMILDGTLEKGDVRIGIAEGGGEAAQAEGGGSRVFDMQVLGSDGVQKMT